MLGNTVYTAAHLLQRYQVIYITHFYIDVSFKNNYYLFTDYFAYQYEHIHHQVNVNISTYARLHLQSGIFAFYLKLFQKFSYKFGSFAAPTVVVVKGEQRSHRPKGGENMKPNSHEQSKRHTFDSFCKKILKHEARDYYDELQRQRRKGKTFSDLSAKEMEQLYTLDKYFVTEQIFNVLGLDVIVTDDVIAGALQSLPEHKRDIILLSYFLELSDREIGDKLNMLRSTVQYQRTKTLQQIKEFMEGDAHE